MQGLRRLVGLELGLGLLLLSGCKTAPVESPPGGESFDPTVSAEVHAVMDEAADPCTDFYRYACGQWMDDNPLPGDQTRYGRFNALRETNKLAMREILDALVADEAAEGERAQLGRFYAACMDEAAPSSLESLEPVMVEIDSARTMADLMKVVAQLHRHHARALFDMDVDAGYDDPGTNIAHLGQAGLGMPDRSYYLDEGAEADALREAYVAHVAFMLGEAGVADAEARARDVMALEGKLATAAVPRDQMRDAERRRNEVDLAGLKGLTPKMPWPAYLEAAGRPGVKSLNVAPPEYFTGMATAVGEAKWPARRAYLTWQLIHSVGPHLPPAMAQAHYEFFDKRLKGQAEPTPRWRRCVEATDRAMGEALGREFVERHFSADSKRIANDMIGQIEQAFADALPQLAWMDDVTRERALEKMHAIVNKVGYPEKWRDYSALEVGADHLANVLGGHRFEWEWDSGKIDQPVDEGEWHMSPPTVNAYYNPSGNEMVFPAGILQPPFFSADRPMAMNFGGIGMVMGHELSHGFDDQGRKFDGEGRLRDWWDPNVVSRFEERAACVEQLYDGYEIQPGVTLNGKLTLGENIADLGGIRQTHGAYRAWAEANGGDATPVVEGLTNEQLLFVSFGQIWCTNATPEAERVLALTDTHSHARYRVNGPLSNFPAFWEAFSCEPGTPMHPENVCEVW